ncbi:MAG: hypothetical protein LBC42_02185 [Puniceicoccales bacterium]|nr:hypothetical protein [Puniceicoccales bacterium]
MSSVHALSPFRPISTDQITLERELFADACANNDVNIDKLMKLRKIPEFTYPFNAILSVLLAFQDGGEDGRIVGEIVNLTLDACDRVGQGADDFILQIINMTAMLTGSSQGDLSPESARKLTAVALESLEVIEPAALGSAKTAGTFKRFYNAAYCCAVNAFFADIGDGFVKFQAPGSTPPLKVTFRPRMAIATSIEIAAKDFDSQFGSANFSLVETYDTVDSFRIGCLQASFTHAFTYPYLVEDRTQQLPSPPAAAPASPPAPRVNRAENNRIDLEQRRQTMQNKAQERARDAAVDPNLEAEISAQIENMERNPDEAIQELGHALAEVSLRRELTDEMIQYAPKRVYDPCEDSSSWMRLAQYGRMCPPLLSDFAVSVHPKEALTRPEIPGSSGGSCLGPSVHVSHANLFSSPQKSIYNPKIAPDKKRRPGHSFPPHEPSHHIANTPLPRFLNTTEGGDHWISVGRNQSDCNSVFGPTHVSCAPDSTMAALGKRKSNVQTFHTALYARGIRTIVDMRDEKTVSDYRAVDPRVEDRTRRNVGENGTGGHVENFRFNPGDEQEAVQMTYINFPIKDLTAATNPATLALMRRIHRNIGTPPGGVVFHCDGGLGRAPTAAVEYQLYRIALLARQAGFNLAFDGNHPENMFLDDETVNLAHILRNCLILGVGARNTFVQSKEQFEALPDFAKYLTTLEPAALEPDAPDPEEEAVASLVEPNLEKLKEWYEDDAEDESEEE